MLEASPDVIPSTNQVGLFCTTKIAVWTLISAAVLASEVGLCASADDSVCPLTRAARELAPCSNNNVFFVVVLSGTSRTSSLWSSTAPLAARRLSGALPRGPDSR
ncbi:uncharacterized [Tachysurus ichikawai]